MTEFVDGASGRRNVCDKKSQRYAKENRTALISVTVNVTNNKRLCSTFCRPTIDRGTDRDEASRGLFATAELLVVTCLYNNNSEQLGKRLRMLWRCLSQTGRIQWHITWTSSIYSQLTRVSLISSHLICSDKTSNSNDNDSWAGHARLKYERLRQPITN